MSCVAQPEIQMAGGSCAIARRTAKVLMSPQGAVISRDYLPSGSVRRLYIISMTEDNIMVVIQVMVTLTTNLFEIAYGVDMNHVSM